jgi:hypothetical protein
MPQYRVVEQKAKSFMKGRMSAQELENLINKYAGEGLVLDRIVAGETAPLRCLRGSAPASSRGASKSQNPGASYDDLESARTAVQVRMEG